MLAYLEQALERFSSELESAKDQDVNHLMIKRGICKLTLGIAKQCIELLQGALDDFYMILNSAFTTVQQQLTAKENIRIVQNAFLIITDHRG